MPGKTRSARRPAATSRSCWATDRCTRTMARATRANWEKTSAPTSWSWPAPRNGPIASSPPAAAEASGPRCTRGGAWHNARPCPVRPLTMRLSRFHLHTTRETPADAEVASHRLMLRAGMIRRLAAGLYTWSPLGLRVLRKVEAIVREEMNAAGAIEMLMPSVQPRELWEESGRWDVFGGQLLKLQDRKEAWYCVGPTHEEVITDFARNELSSYKQLPVNFYPIRSKFRDESRPRFGVMGAR